MSEQQTIVYIASISGGVVIANEQNDKNICRLRTWSPGSDAQKWIMEYDTPTDRAIAFKNVADGKYLVTLEPNKKNGGTVGVSTRKQWWGFWKAQKATGPGWFHVSSTECQGAYLNNEWGKDSDNNRIQTYDWEVS